MVAQAELQSAVAGLEAGIPQRLLELRRVLPQHRQGFRPLDRHMRGHLAFAVDIHADIDAAELGGVETNFEAALAALRGGGDLDRQPAQGDRGVGRCRRRQVCDGNGRGHGWWELQLLLGVNGLRARVGWAGLHSCRRGLVMGWGHSGRYRRRTSAGGIALRGVGG